MNTTINTNLNTTTTLNTKAAGRHELEQLIRDLRWEHFNFDHLLEDCCIDCVFKTRYQYTQEGLTDIERKLIDSGGPVWLMHAYPLVAGQVHEEIEARIAGREQAFAKPH